MKEKVVAIVPCYNEEQNIKEVIAGAEKHVDEIIVVDDGSRDNTYSNAKETGAIVLKHIINMGKGAAMKTGIEKAIDRKADKIVLIDGDGQHSPDDIPRLLKELEEHDLIIGEREFNKDMPTIYRVGNWGLDFGFRLLFKSKVLDTQNGFRAFKSNIYPLIKWDSSSYSVETEMIVNAIKNKLKYKGIKISTKYLDKYKGTTITDGLKYAYHMVVWRLKW